MSSKFSNKYPIPEKFPEILHDFAREVVRYMPKDILDFAIQYFYYLEQNKPLKYEEGASKDLPKISYALEQKERAKESRGTISTPSLATNPNTQNLFYAGHTDLSSKKNELDTDKEKEEEIKEVKETISSKINTPIATEESKPESYRTNGSGIVGLSKNFVNKVFEKNQQKVKEALHLEKITGSDENNIESAHKNEKFNKSGTTFSNVSGNSSAKNGVRHFVGEVFNESKKKAQ